MQELTVQIKDIKKDYDLRTDPRLIGEFIESKVSGVYAFEDTFTGELYYIGKSTNLRGRVSYYDVLKKRFQAENGSEKKLHKLIWEDRIIVAVCKVERGLIALTETWNIREHKPSFNVHEV